MLWEMQPYTPLSPNSDSRLTKLLNLSVQIPTSCEGNALSSDASVLILAKGQTPLKMNRLELGRINQQASSIQTLWEFHLIFSVN